MAALIGVFASFAWRALLFASLLAFAARGQERVRLEPAAPGEIPVDVEADHLTSGELPGVWILEGHVVAHRAGARLRSSRAVLDRGKNTLLLEGGVVAAQGNQLALADKALIDLTGKAADLGGAVLYIKEGTPDLSGILEPQAARGSGRNALTARASRAEQGAGGALSLREVIATPCDCAAQPDYVLLAGSALVKDDRARLTDVHLQLVGATVPFLPVSLPLLDRQSGMLAPQFSSNPAGGLRLGLPIFLVTGPQSDVTLTGAWHFGGGGAGREMSGPHLTTELRSWPFASLKGALTLDLLQDLSASLSPGSAAAFAGERPTQAGRGFHGLRGSLALDEKLTLGTWTAGLEGTLYSDALFPSDTTRLPPGFGDLSRIDLGLLHTEGPLSYGASAAVLQDVRADPAFGTSTVTGDRRLFGSEARATPQRLPSPFVQLAPVRLGPLTLGGEASAASFFTPIASAQERATGFAPTDLDAAGTPPAAEPSGADLSRAGALRLDLAPRATLSLPAGLPVRGRLLLGGRADAWFHPARSGLDAQRLQAFADAEVSLLLARSFGPVLHTLEPRLQVRSLTPALLSGTAPGDPADAGGFSKLVDPAASEYGLPFGAALASGTSTASSVPAVRRAYDEIDGSAPPTGGSAASLSLRQALWTRPNGQGLRRALWLTLSQDWVLRDGAGSSRAADSSVLLGAEIDHATFVGEVRADPSTRRVGYTSAALQLSDARQDSLRVGVTAQRAAATDKIRAGIDELIATTRLALASGDFGGTLTAGAAWQIPVEVRGLFLSTDYTYWLNQQPAGYPSMRLAPAFNWRPPCGCAQLGVRLDFPLKPGGAPDFNFVFDLKSLGGH
jgi:hypothetical protein